MTAPYDVYLMHVCQVNKWIPLAKADEIYNQLQNAGVQVLYDGQDERAGVKF